MMVRPRRTQDKDPDAKLDEFQGRLIAVQRRLDHIQSLLTAIHSREDSNRGGPILIDAVPGTATIGKSTISLTPTEYKLLELLNASKDGVRVKAIAAELRGSGGDTTEGSVRVMISHLRQKLRLIRSADLIETVPRYGYRLRRPVRMTSPDLR
jgi:DNA-binding response OmpR family regulator